MLVLLRKVGEEIVIGGDVVVGVARVSQNRVSLTIQAPTNVRVDREEIRLAKNRDLRAAGFCKSAERQAGPGETKQGTSDREASGYRVFVDPLSGVRCSPFVRKAIPMLNQVSEVRKRREDLVEYNSPHWACQQGGRLAQPDTTSIVAVIDRLIARGQAGSGPEIEFYDDIPICELPSDLQTTVFSIVQELLWNACRYSKSKHVLVGLAQDDDRIWIQVQDWGVGFVPEMVQPHKLGLKGIQQLVQWHGGTVSVDSRPGTGTCIVVEIPLLPETETSDQTEARRPR